MERLSEQRPAERRRPPAPPIQGWVQEWADVELVEHIELLEAQVARLQAERAELSRASSQQSAEIIAASYELPRMAEEYLAALPPPGVERRLEEESASITRDGLALLAFSLLAFSLLAAWAVIGLSLVWLLAL